MTLHPKGEVVQACGDASRAPLPSPLARSCIRASGSWGYAALTPGCDIAPIQGAGGDAPAGRDN